ncbi:hypothetical protein ACFV29_24590 [Streptomyces sp. NPDC059690]
MELQLHTKLALDRAYLCDRRLRADLGLMARAVSVSRRKSS